MIPCPFPGSTVEIRGPSPPPQFFGAAGRPFWPFSKWPVLVTTAPPLNPGIVATARYQPWRPTAALAPHISFELERSCPDTTAAPFASPLGLQFLAFGSLGIFRTESPSSMVRHESPSQQILKSKHVLESQGDVLEKPQGRHIMKIPFKG